MLGESMRRRRGGRRSGGSAAKPRRSAGPGLSWRRWLLFGALAVVLAFGVGYLASIFVFFPVPEEAVSGGVPVPDLVGDDLDQARAELRAVGLALGEVTELADDDAAPGVVLAQSSLGGQQLRAGGTVDVAVAARRGEARVPPVVGLTADAAIAVLGMAGLEAQRREIDGEDIAGRVVGTDPQPGAPVRRPGPVTLLVSAGVPALPEIQPLTPLGDPLEPPIVDPIRPDTSGNREER